MSIICYVNKENIYWEKKGNIFIVLNISLHESVFLKLLMILIIFFWILNISMP
jgi:hypothetical protein